MAPDPKFSAKLACWFRQFRGAEDFYNSVNVRREFYKDDANVDIMRLLLEVGADVAEKTPEEGESLLHLATANAPRVRILLDNRADKLHVDELGPQGRTPLHYAAAAGFEDTMEVLLEHGANPDVSNDYQSTTLHFGVHSAACTKSLLTRISGNRTLINAQDRFCRTALHYYAMLEEPDEEVVSMLLGAGIKTGTVDLNGKTAGSYARLSFGSYGNEEAIGWMNHMLLFRYYEMRKEALRAPLDNQAIFQQSMSRSFNQKLNDSAEAAKTWTVVSDSDDENYETPSKHVA